ncbi:MarR family winged helix-turn-helix transcriptional regulator [Cohnella zeiphila]|uniref:MarR family transcriptional regulator n=1 Tax=Cohnella zeiphila TaxID=2761120 RepID=A0A7X0SN73_9BACL|nr:MarR family transcriptional regulator [Cohnella zeiphila]MBB6733092.1 MarR family transcriptional regulator [Cohnella zeiphila]
MDNALLNQLIDRYKEAMFTVERRLHVLLREAMPEELTLEQYCILQYAKSRGRCTSTELSELLSVGKSSITAMIGRLFDKQLILRIPDDKDRRVTYLELTLDGERLTREANDSIAKVLSGYLLHFDEAEATQFIETYEKLAQALSLPTQE